MVLPAKIDGKNVHASIVGPVIGEGDNELNIGFSSGVNHLVELGDVDGGCAIFPPLENGVGCARAFAAVLW